ncbi:MAG: L,D-transpeptidase [Candidatus Dormibacteraeota bacterium]|nr:L,D-transpeptidase [Candidatus Dormibacteraeota bacterium]
MHRTRSSTTSSPVWPRPRERLDFGAGSENGFSDSHGCIRVPTAAIAWLYGWVGMGTTVIITG